MYSAAILKGSGHWCCLSDSPGPATVLGFPPPWYSSSKVKLGNPFTTFSDGCLGSISDEGRSEVR